MLVLCHDVVGAKMSGSGIRYYNIAQQIKKIANVSLGVYSEGKDQVIPKDVFQVKTTGDDYKSLFDQHDIIFAQWLSGDMLAYAKSSGKIVIIDLYAPVPVEYLASLGFAAQKVNPDKDIEFSGIIETYSQYLTLGDYFVCSNDRQRDYWLGFMTAIKAIMPTNFNTISKMEHFALCPMGISSTPPTRTTLQLRKRAGLGKDDFVMLWTGGIWDWFDAQVVIRAIKKLDNPHIKLVFLGTQHPNSKVPEMDESKAARKLSKKLGLLGQSVFFLDGWIDYEKRASYLMDADIAIYADKESIETRFSHRTRVLDHIWVGLPTICSKGDYLSEVIKQNNLGDVVDDRSSDSFARAINKVFSNPELLATMKKNIAHVRPEFTWDQVTKDLLGFIEKSHSNTVSHIATSPSSLQPKNPSYSQKVKRRVKNSIKVLLGRIDV